MIKKEMICLVCPRGCHLEVEQEGEKIAVRGNFCQKGIPYAHAEMKHPERALTTTVFVEGGSEKLVPVKSEKALPKDKLMAAMAVLKNVKLHAPLRRGDVAYSNILDSGIDILVTRSISKI